MFHKIERYLIKRMVKRYKLGFSQFGEEKIVKKILSKIGVKKIYYLDIGTNDPLFNNNTFLFYSHGHKGVCIEANPNLALKIKKERPRDICLNVGASARNDNSREKFYISESTVLSSFSKVNASAASNISKTIEVPILGINKILSEVCERIPDFVSLDIEGMEILLLRGLDFKKYRPPIFCIETLDIKGNKSKEIIDFMKNNNYLILADTYVNTIFVDKSRWESK